MPRPTLRDQLAEVAAHLHNGKTAKAAQWADAIDTVLAPGGWHTLRTTDTPKTNEGAMQLRLPKELRDELVAAVAANNQTVTGEVEEGFRQFLAGAFVPTKPARSAYGSGANTYLNVTPVAELRNQVKAAADMSAPNVAVDYLLRKYNLGPYAAEKKSPRSSAE